MFNLELYFVRRKDGRTERRRLRRRLETRGGDSVNFYFAPENTPESTPESATKNGPFLHCHDYHPDSVNLFWPDAVLDAGRVVAGSG